MAAQEQGDQYRNLILLSFLTAAHNYKNLPENKRLYSMAKEKYVTKYGAVNDKLIRAAAENMIPRSVDSVVSFLNNQPKYIQENEYAVKAEYKAWLNLVASRMMISEKFPELKEASEVQNLNQLIASSRKKINDLLEKEKVLNGRVNTTDSVLDLLGYLTLIVSAITTVLLVLAPAAGIPLSAGLTALGIVAIPLGGVTIANSVHKERYIELQTMRSKIVKLVDLELSTRKKIVNILLTNDKLRAEIDNLSLNSQDEQPLNLDHLK